VSPAEFIPVAEATGLIESIGEWMMREATKEACRWPDDTVVAMFEFRLEGHENGSVVARAQAG
jgi:EAL domain-containing protein (putative c-di-GMP-specific phosphodiesterase class I)